MLFHGPSLVVPYLYKCLSYDLQNQEYIPPSKICLLSFKVCNCHAISVFDLGSALIRSRNRSKINERRYSSRDSDEGLPLHLTDDNTFLPPWSELNEEDTNDVISEALLRSPESEIFGSDDMSLAEANETVSAIDEDRLLDGAAAAVDDFWMSFKCDTRTSPPTVDMSLSTLSDCEIYDRESAEASSNVTNLTETFGVDVRKQKRSSLSTASIVSDKSYGDTSSGISISNLAAEVIESRRQLVETRCSSSQGNEIVVDADFTIGCDEKKDESVTSVSYSNCVVDQDDGKVTNNTIFEKDYRSSLDNSRSEARCLTKISNAEGVFKNILTSGNSEKQQAPESASESGIYCKESVKTGNTVDVLERTRNSGNTTEYHSFSLFFLRPSIIEVYSVLTRITIVVFCNKFTDFFSNRAVVIILRICLFFNEYGNYARPVEKDMLPSPKLSQSLGAGPIVVDPFLGRKARAIGGEIARLKRQLSVVRNEKEGESAIVEEEELLQRLNDSEAAVLALGNRAVAIAAAAETVMAGPSAPELGEQLMGLREQLEAAVEVVGLTDSGYVNESGAGINCDDEMIAIERAAADEYITALKLRIADAEKQLFRIAAYEAEEEDDLAAEDAAAAAVFAAKAAAVRAVADNDAAVRAATRREAAFAFSPEHENTYLAHLVTNMSLEFEVSPT